MERNTLGQIAKERFDAQWEYGHKREAQVIRYLQDTFHTVIRPSSRDENILEDIDCWMGNTSISIKSQDIALRTKNFGFELEMHNKERDEWVPSWYFTGKAQYYVIIVGETCYQLCKQRLQDYVNEHGWDSVKQLSPRVAASQAHRAHDQYTNGLLSIKTALVNNIARVI